MTNRQWRLVARPEGDIKDSDFAWHEDRLRAPADGEVVVRGAEGTVSMQRSITAQKTWLRR